MINKSYLSIKGNIFSMRDIKAALDPVTIAILIILILLVVWFIIRTQGA
jgi:hypothetical protein